MDLPTDNPSTALLLDLEVTEALEVSADMVALGALGALEDLPMVALVASEVLEPMEALVASQVLEPMEASVDLTAFKRL